MTKIPDDDFALKSYFIRHTEKMIIDPKTIEELFENDKFAIHFPDNGHEDKRSLNSEDYHLPKHGNAVKRFCHFAEIGGFIWAQYYISHLNRVKIKIGKVLPQEVELKDTVWAQDYNEDGIRRNKGDVAVIKTLQISDPIREIPPRMLMDLRAARPIKGTFSQWPAIRNKLCYYAYKKRPPWNWDNLSTPQQETACAEYLREPHNEGLPVLAQLLLPVGRTLEDVDIYGCTEDGSLIYGQVTFSSYEDCTEKIENLKAYSGNNVSLLFFCEMGNVERGLDEEIMFIPIANVLKWLDNKSNMKNALLRPD